MGLKKYIETNDNGSYYQIFNTVPEPLVDVNRVTEGKTSPKSSPPPSNNHTSASQSSSHTYSSSNASKHMPVLQVSLGWRVMCTCKVLMIQGFFFCLCIAGFCEFLLFALVTRVWIWRWNFNTIYFFDRRLWHPLQQVNPRQCTLVHHQVFPRTYNVQMHHPTSRLRQHPLGLGQVSTHMYQVYMQMSHLHHLLHITGATHLLCLVLTLVCFSESWFNVFLFYTREIQAQDLLCL